MYVVVARNQRGNVVVYGSFLTDVVAQAWADARPEFMRGCEFAVCPINGDPELPSFMELQPVVAAEAMKVPHPSIVAEARRQQKADACDAPFFLKGRCTNCGTSVRRHLAKKG